MKKCMLVALVIVLSQLSYAQSQFPPNWAEVSYGVQSGITATSDACLNPITNGVHALIVQEVAVNDKRLYEVYPDASGVIRKKEVCNLNTSFAFSFVPVDVAISIDTTGKVCVAVAGAQWYVWYNAQGQSRLGGLLDVYYMERTNGQNWSVPLNFRRVFRDAKKADQDIPFMFSYLDLHHDQYNRPALLLSSSVHVRVYNSSIDDYDFFSSVHAILCDPRVYSWNYGDNYVKNPSQEDVMQGRTVYSFEELLADEFGPTITAVAVNRNMYDNSAGANTRYGVCVGFLSYGTLIYRQIDILSSGYQNVTSDWDTVLQSNTNVDKIGLVSVDHSKFFWVGLPHISYSRKVGNAEYSSYYTNKIGSFSQHTLIAGSSLVGSVTYSKDNMTAMTSILLLDSGTSSLWDAKVRMYHVWNGAHQISLLKEFSSSALDANGVGYIPSVLPLVMTKYDVDVGASTSRYNVLVCDRHFIASPFGFYPWTLLYMRNTP